MAMAMQRVHKGTQVTIGPWIERGFYYDFDVSGAEQPFTDKVLKKVQKEMRRIIRKDLPFVCETVTAEEARQRIQELGEPYKLEILEGIVAKYALCLTSACGQWPGTAGTAVCCQQGGACMHTRDSGCAGASLLQILVCRKHKASTVRTPRNSVRWNEAKPYQVVPYF
jgi:hypothetical protein